MSFGDGRQHLTDDGLIAGRQGFECFKAGLPPKEQGMLVRVGHMPGKVVQGLGELRVRSGGADRVLQAAQQAQALACGHGGGVGHGVGQACQQVGQPDLLA